MATDTRQAPSLPDSLGAPGGDRVGEGTPWGRAFRVDGRENAPITLKQVTAKSFDFVGTLDYVGSTGLDPRKYPRITDAMRRQARRLDGRLLGATDLASVPLFLRWFEGPYGRHTPAALIHDELIGTTPNSGALRSDTASDRLFRYMLAAVGVPFFKRWIMWAAVAWRTRCAVGGWRRASAVVWVLLAVAGIAATGMAVAALAAGNNGPADVNATVLLAAALAAPLVAGGLWGRQWGAGVVTAAAAPFLFPPMAIAAAGYLVYWVLERSARAIGLD